MTASATQLNLQISLGRDAERYSALIAVYYFGVLFLRAFLGGTNLGNVPIVLWSLMFFCLSANAFLKCRKQLNVLTISLPIFFLALSLNVFFDGYGLKKIVGDTSIFVNGPLVFIWVWALSSQYSGQGLSKNMPFVAWCFATGAIMFSAATGVGLHTYEAFNLGWKFFFVSNNELTFCYSLLTGYLVLSTKMRFIPLYLASCVVVIATKAGLMGVAILLFVLSVRGVRLMNRSLARAYLTVLILFALFILFQADISKLVQSILPLFSMSAGFEKLASKIEYAGLWEAILSGRGRFVSFAWDEYIHSGMGTILFGFGFSDFKVNFGANFGKESFTEVDSVDILMSFGALGLFAYLSLLVFMFRQWLKQYNRRTKYAEIYLFIFLMFTLVGNASGHVVFSAWAMATVALLLGITASFARHTTSDARAKNKGPLTCISTS